MRCCRTNTLGLIFSFLCDRDSIHNGEKINKAFHATAVARFLVCTKRDYDDTCVICGLRVEYSFDTAMGCSECNFHICYKCDPDKQWCRNDEWGRTSCGTCPPEDFDYCASPMHGLLVCEQYLEGGYEARLEIYEGDPEGLEWRVGFCSTCIWHE